MRQLRLDGADLTNSLGVDVEESFIKMGHHLFRDGSNALRFDIADIFHTNEQIWESLQGKVDVVNISNFFHAFDWDRQVSAARQVARMLRPPSGNQNSLVVGCTVGSIWPREVAIVSKEKASFCHNTESFQKLWNQVGQGLGMEFNVGSALNPLEKELRVGPLAEDSMKMLVFDVEISAL